eukprot:5708855-Alexandrium_andersonii.AAC.1
MLWPLPDVACQREGRQESAPRPCTFLEQDAQYCERRRRRRGSEAHRREATCTRLRPTVEDSFTASQHPAREVGRSDRALCAVGRGAGEEDHEEVVYQEVDVFATPIQEARRAEGTAH